MSGKKDGSKSLLAGYRAHKEHARAERQGMGKSANERNFCVIMAGGVGSRFWPYSRNDRPKQFLDFFGTGRSLIQMTVDRFRPLVPIENVIIVTNVAYRDILLQQIPDLHKDQILCEPARRNTAPCIAYAVYHIKGMIARRLGVKDVNLIDFDDERYNANIIVAPSDHLIMQENKFLQVVLKGFSFIEKHDALLTLGMQPTRPETGYGYIQKDTQSVLQDSDFYKVKTFTEKPNLELAKVFVDSGEFLWNSGIFMWNLRAIRQAYAEHLPVVADIFRSGEQWMGTKKEEDFIQEMFPKCPNISIDYGVMEKAKNVYVLPASFGWSDLGTWGSLYELSEKDATQNVQLHSDVMFYNSHGNIVTLEKGKLAVIEGLEDMIVAESEGVLLVCKKEHEQQIKEWVGDAQSRFGGKYI